MLTEQLSYLDACMIILVFALLLSHLGMLRKMRKRMAGTEKQVESVANYHKIRLNDLESDIALLKEALKKREANFKQEISEQSKRNDLRMEEMNGVILKVDNKMGPMREALSEATDRLEKIQDSMMNKIRENAEAGKALENEINAIRDEIEDMKDLIQGRIIDIEL